MTMYKYFGLVLFSISPLVVPMIIWLAGFAFGNTLIQTVGRRLGKWLAVVIGGWLIYCTLFTILLWTFGKGKDAADDTPLQMFSIITTVPMYVFALIGLVRRGTINFK